MKLPKNRQKSRKKVDNGTAKKPTKAEKKSIMKLPKSRQKAGNEVVREACLICRCGKLFLKTVFPPGFFILHRASGTQNKNTLIS